LTVVWPYGKNNAAMRILTSAGFYPPYSLSGHDLGCRDIVESLKARGHDVLVLTSRICYPDDRVEGDVRRLLKPAFREKLDWRSAILKELVNQTAFKRVCREFSPQVALFFNPTYVSASLGLLAREMGIPAATYIADFWFLTYEKDHWYRTWPRSAKRAKALRHFGRYYRLVPASGPLPFGQAIFANRYLQNLAEQVCLPMDGAAVVPWGIDVGRFSPPPIPQGIDVGRFAPRPAAAHPPRRLLYVGQVRPNKRLDTAIQALGILARDRGRTDLSLTVVGYDPWDPSPLAVHQKAFRALVERYGLRDKVRFTGWKPREAMPAVYREHDIFIFPGTDEGSTSLAPLEAMASGLAVVSTLTKGHADFLRDGTNALIFSHGVAEECARQVERLVDDPALGASLGAQARATIEQGFRLDKAGEAVEGALIEATRRAAPATRMPAAEKKPLLKDPDPGASLDRLAARAKWRLRLGALVVTARTLLRPQFFWQTGKKYFEKATARTLVIVLPLFYEAFFRLAGRRPRRSRQDQTRPKNILVIQLADIGDVLLTGIFLRELRRSRPDAWIGLVVQPSKVNLVEKCPYVDEIIPFEWRSFRNWGQAFSGHWRWWVQTTCLSFRRLWKRRVDLAISLRWNNDAPQAAGLTLMFASGAPERVGYRDTPHDRVPYRVTDINRLITRGPVRTFLKHEVELQLEILSSLGATPADTHLEVWTGPEDDAFARNALQTAGFSDGGLTIALAPGAAWPFRRWPAERFIGLGNWLQQTYGANIVILADAHELALARRIEGELAARRTLNLGGKTTILQMAAVLKHCRLFIGNDSGPMHVAAGVGVAVVSFFGPGEYERFRPWGIHYEPIRLGLPCSPCSQECPFNDPRCIRGISLERAKEVVARMLS